MPAVALHVTAWSGTPGILTRNCCVFPGESVTAGGYTSTLGACSGGGQLKNSTASRAGNEVIQKMASRPTQNGAADNVTNARPTSVSPSCATTETILLMRMTRGAA